MSTDTDETVRHGTPNLAADLGYADADAHLLKAELVDASTSGSKPAA